MFVVCRIILFFFHLFFDGGLSSTASGSGRSYLMRIFLTAMNQLLLLKVLISSCRLASRTSMDSLGNLTLVPHSKRLLRISMQIYVQLFIRCKRLFIEYSLYSQLLKRGTALSILSQDTLYYNAVQIGCAGANSSLLLPR